ncbi:MAG TPA: phosphatidylserine decarboxylase [Vicinamibacterales bacterium]|nr:phosphatidylserine decarboxylase [Vicinamibacterales bacterium]
MGIDRAGWPFILVAVAVAVIAGVWFGRAWSVPFLILAAFFLFFFRDPDRHPPAGDNLVLSPADARVMVVGDVPWKGAPPGDWQIISMFLSPMDVHVNRAPVAGKVTRVEYHPGKFLAAYKSEAGELNEWTEVWFDRPGGPVVVRQIVGVLARRIVCRLKAGDQVAAGDRFGVMKFGSRIDMFLPRAATILVKAGDKVVGGETKLATLAPQP